MIPRNKASYSLAWSAGNFTSTMHGSRLGGLPNYNGDTRLGATYLHNGSVNYRVGGK